MMKKYLGNSYKRNDDCDSDNAINGRVMMMLRLMIIMILMEGDDNIIIIMMMVVMFLTRRYVE